MAEAAVQALPDLSRESADRLRSIARRARSVSRRGLEDVFALGAAFEEAADVLKGSFGAWVASQCGIEPRTALGYRKAHRHLADRKDWLVERRVTPSVAVLVASAAPEARRLCLEAIHSGRDLTASQTRAIVRQGGQPGGEAISREFKRAVRAGSAAFVDRIRHLAAAAGEGGVDDARLTAAAAEAARLLPAAEALLGGAAAEPHPVLRILGELAAPAVPEVRARALLELGAALEEAPPATRDPPPRAEPERSGIQSVHSAFGHGLRTLEICAGGGGQAAGLAQAGFRHVALVERDPSACRTLRAAFGDGHVVEGDLAAYAPSPEGIGPLDLLAGGVPCQPFSQLGEMRGPEDARDLFPEALRLVETLRPRAVMIENVTGILAPKFDLYRFGILSRLERAGYAWQWRKVDATHFGVPQRRRRAILVAFREPEAMARFVWPGPVARYAEDPSTVYDALHAQIVARGYEPPEELARRMDRPAPTITGASDRKASPDFGKRKAGAIWGGMGFVQTRIGDAPPEADHEGPLVATNRMLARLQNFPFDWPFEGSKKFVFRQIANAFPSTVALHLGCAIASALTGERHDPMGQVRYQAMRFTFRRQARLRTLAAARVDHATRSAPSTPLAPSAPSGRLVPLKALGNGDGRPRDVPLDPPDCCDEHPSHWPAQASRQALSTGARRDRRSCGDRAPQAEGAAG